MWTQGVRWIFIMIISVFVGQHSFFLFPVLCSVCVCVCVGGIFLIPLGSVYLGVEFWVLFAVNTGDCLDLKVLTVRVKWS